MAPTFFNVYTNDQLIGKETQHFAYANDLAVMTQGDKIEMVENKLEKMLEILGQYDHKNLKPNPSKTQIYAFHLCNKQVNRKIKVKWQGEFLEHCDTTTYLGMTLDRTFIYKNHCETTQTNGLE